MIENQYKDKTPEQVWNEWNELQRQHFIQDHTGKQHTPASVIEFSKKNYKFIPFNIKNEILKHISIGQYAKGGEIGKPKFNVGDNTKLGKITDIRIGTTKKQYEQQVRFKPRKKYEYYIGNDWYNEGQVEYFMAQGGKIDRCPIGTVVQTLIFDKEYFTEQQAKDWAKKHDFKYGYVDEKENTYRIRQIEPDELTTMRTIEFKEGLKAVIGCPKGKMEQGGEVKEKNGEWRYYVCKYTNWYEGGIEDIWADQYVDSMPSTAKDIKIIYAKSGEEAITKYKKMKKMAEGGLLNANYILEFWFFNKKLGEIKF